MVVVDAVVVAAAGVVLAVYIATIVAVQAKNNKGLVSLVLLLLL